MRDPIKLAQGFTLIELIIVLVITVLGFAALSINISSGDQATKLQAAAREIASALRYAHGQALITHNPTAVTINLDDNSYRIGNDGKIYRFAEQIDVSLVVAEDEFNSGEGSIRFFNDGSSTGGRITLEWGKQIRRIDVNWITGEVSIGNVAA